MPRKAIVLLNGNTLDKQGRGRGAVLIMGGLAAPVGTGLCVGFSGELHISYRHFGVATVVYMLVIAIVEHRISGLVIRDVVI